MLGPLSFLTVLVALVSLVIGFLATGGEHREVEWWATRVMVSSWIVLFVLALVTGFQLDI